MLLVVFAACTSASDDGPGGGGSGAVDDVDAAGAISAAIVVSDEGDGAARILIASTKQLCSDARATPPIARKGQTLVMIDLHDVTGAGTTAPSAPGTYTIYPNTGSRPEKSASLQLATLDASCQQDVQASGQSGSVALSSVTGGKFAGSYNVVLNTEERITGVFDPTPCPEMQALVDSADDHSCLP